MDPFTESLRGNWNHHDSVAYIVKMVRKDCDWDENRRLKGILIPLIHHLAATLTEKQIAELTECGESASNERLEGWMKIELLKKWGMWPLNIPEKTP